MGGTISSLAFPTPEMPKSFYEGELLRRHDLIYLTTSAGERIPCVHKKAGSANAAKPLTLLYSHGNAEDIGLHLPFVDGLARATGCDVLSYEYVGYSLSKLEGGEASEAGCLRSVDAAWRYLVEELKLPPAQIVIFGRSIGTGPSVDLASRAAVEGTTHSPLAARGVLLQSPISSGARAVLGTAASVVGYPLDIFRNYMKIDKITAPVAIVHGTADEVVPCSNGRALHAKLQQPFEPLWMEGRGHNDVRSSQSPLTAVQKPEVLLAGSAADAGAGGVRVRPAVRGDAAGDGAGAGAGAQLDSSSRAS